jgi:molybdate transport system substrate-binding protein
MPELVRVYQTTHPGAQVSVMYGASGDLERQVIAGAPVDAVVFAGAHQVDDLIKEGRAIAASRRVLATNELVLVGRRGGPPLTFATLGTVPGGDLIAVGDPRTVPAGEYARDYLRGLGSWDALSSHFILGSSVAAVLVYARRGEAIAAIVYKTELHDSSDLVVLDEARGASAPLPEVVAAAVQGGHAEAVDFLGFVSSAAASAVFTSFGFGPR